MAFSVAVVTAVLMAVAPGTEPENPEALAAFFTDQGAQFCAQTAAQLRERNDGTLYFCEGGEHE